MSDKQDDRCDIPVQVSDSEHIARLYISPYHIKKNKPKPAAFKPTPHTDEVSVVRIDRVGDAFCITKGKELADRKQEKDSPKFKGFGRCLVGDVRLSGFGVHDSRIAFCGHAHISIGMVQEVGEPLSAEENKRLDAICRELMTLFGFEPDSEGRES